MDLRARILASMKQAMKEKDAERLSTVRLISAAIKDRDISARAYGNDDGVDETEVMAILGKMTRQRQMCIRDSPNTCFNEASDERKRCRAPFDRALDQRGDQRQRYRGARGWQ